MQIFWTEPLHRWDQSAVLLALAGSVYPTEVRRYLPYPGAYSLDKMQFAGEAAVNPRQVQIAGKRLLYLATAATGRV